MRWKIILSLACALLFVAGIAATDDPEGFRGIVWGTPYDEVVEELRQTLGPEAESGRNEYDQIDFMAWEDVLFFEIPSVMFAECSPADGLIRGWYLFRYGIQQDESQWISDFDHLAEALTVLYGEPCTSGPIWFGGDEEQYKDDLSGALHDGKASFGSVWCFPTTSVELSLEKMGMFGGCWLVLIYKHSSRPSSCNFF